MPKTNFGERAAVAGSSPVSLGIHVWRPVGSTAGENLASAGGGLVGLGSPRRSPRKRWSLLLWRGGGVRKKISTRSFAKEGFAPPTHWAELGNAREKRRFQRRTLRRPCPTAVHRTPEPETGREAARPGATFPWLALLSPSPACCPCDASPSSAPSFLGQAVACRGRCGGKPFGRRGP